MSSDPNVSVHYALTKPVSSYMNIDVLKLHSSTQTREAARQMQHYEKDDIIVMDDSGKPIGIVTDEDILRKVSDAAIYAEATMLGDIMTSPLVTIDSKATVQEALDLMREKSVRKLPVVSKKGDIEGMVHQPDIAEAIRKAAMTPARLLSPPVKAILGNLGFVLQFSGVLLLVPAVLATFLNDTVSATGIYLSTVLLLVTGFFLNSYGEKSALNMQQASILVFASTFLLILYGSVPYLYVTPFTFETPVEAFSTAFMSSASGFTTAGLSVFDAPEDLPQSFTFYRGFTQLIGGMSFIYLVITAFYPESKLKAMRGFITGKTLHVRELFGTITVIFTIYMLIIVGLLYLFGSHDIIDNFSLVMSTLATGGFYPSSTIINEMNTQQHIILIATMIIGSLPFTFHYGFVRKRFLVAKLGKEVLVYFGILALGIGLFIWASGADAVSGAFFAVSAGTTTGLQNMPLDKIGPITHLILVGLMIAGGCGFSTAGGVKIFRLFHLAKLRVMRKSLKLAGLSDEERKDLIAVLVMLSALPVIAMVSAVHLEAATGATYENAFFECVSAITTGGLSADVISIELDPASKMLMGFLMLIGRVEIIAIMYIFMPKLG